MKANSDHDGPSRHVRRCGAALAQRGLCADLGAIPALSAEAVSKETLEQR